MINRYVGSTSAQKTLKIYFMNNNSKTIPPIDKINNVSSSIVWGTPDNKDYTKLSDRFYNSVSMVNEIIV